MARNVFFSFHYQQDIMRVNVVRKSQEFARAYNTQEFYDRSIWEKTKLQGDAAIKKLIDDGLKGCSVTVVLVGAETAGRKWINYEITESRKQGMGLLAVRIHGIQCLNQGVCFAGRNPFDVKQNNGTVCFSQIYPIYDWVKGYGFTNLPKWIEQAARKAGR